MVAFDNLNEYVMLCYSRNYTSAKVVAGDSSDRESQSSFYIYRPLRNSLESARQICYFLFRSPDVCQKPSKMLLCFFTVTRPFICQATEQRPVKST